MKPADEQTWKSSKRLTKAQFVTKFVDGQVAMTN